MGEPGSQVEEDGVPRFHVHRAAAPQGSVLAQLAGDVAGHGNGVDVSGQEDARRPPEVRPGDDGVAVAQHPEVVEARELGLDEVREGAFPARDGRDAHQVGGELYDVVEVHASSLHARPYCVRTAGEAAPAALTRGSRAHIPRSPGDGGGGPA